MEKKNDVVDGDPFQEDLSSSRVNVRSSVGHSTVAEYDTQTDVRKDENLAASLVPRYNMTHADRGFFVIFNQNKFEKMPKRDGTYIDASELTSTAEFLGFTNVQVHHDCNHKEIMEHIKYYAFQDHDNYDCFVCCILTHGEKLTTKAVPESKSEPTVFTKEVLYAKDAAFELNDLKKPFEADKCPSLAGKPKLFFVQACRGTKFDNGMELSDLANDEREKMVKRDGTDAVDGPIVAKKRIPVEADFLFGHCTVPDYYAWRSRRTGSYFIRELCTCLRKYGHTNDVEQIMKLVNHNIAMEFESDTVEKQSSFKKQMPTFSSQLTKSLYFTRRTVVEK